MSCMNIRIQVGDNGTLPKKAHDADACFDLYAAEDVSIFPEETRVVNTKLVIEIPDGYCGHVYSRSGLAAKNHIAVLNAPGIIDSNYRGEIMIIVHNFDLYSTFHIKKGDRIAQLAILPVERICFIEEKEKNLSETERGENGLGSSGI